MAISGILLGALIVIISFIISSLPLYFAVKFLGGKTSIFKTVMVAFVSGLLFSAIKSQVKMFGSIVAFFVLIWIYREMFKLKWHKAFFAWVLQFVFLALFYIIFAFILAAVIGLSVVTLLV